MWKVSELTVTVVGERVKVFYFLDKLPAARFRDLRRWHGAGRRLHFGPRFPTFWTDMLLGVTVPALVLSFAATRGDFPESDPVCAEVSRRRQTELTCNS